MKILIVDDHALFRSGLVHLLQSFEPSPEVVDTGDLVGAQEILLSDAPADLVLLDLKLQVSSGVESLLLLRQQFPDIAVVVLSGETDPVVIHSCIQNGAMGYISKAATHEELLSAITLIVAGGVYLPKEITRVQATSDYTGSAGEQDVLAKLSERQREVLTYVIQGKPNKTISEKLNISQNTVKAHLSGIFKLLGASNRTEAVYIAV